CLGAPPPGDQRTNRLVHRSPDDDLLLRGCVHVSPHGQAATGRQRKTRTKRAQAEARRPRAGRWSFSSRSLAPVGRFRPPGGVATSPAALASASQRTRRDQKNHQTSNVPHMNVLIVDDQRSARRILTTLLASEEGMTLQ